VLDAPLPDPPANTATRVERDRYEKKCDESNEVSCLMLVSMAPDLQKRFEDMSAYDMIGELKNMFQEQTRVERYHVAMEFFECKMNEGASVSAHVQKLMGLMEQLGKLDSTMDLQLSTDLILHSLPPSFSMFVMNYNMAGAIKSLNELHSMLSTAETSIRRVPDVLAVTGYSKKVMKGKRKGKRKAKGKGKAHAGSKSTPKLVKVSTSTLDTVYFHCNGKSHFKRECPKFLEEQKAGSSTSGIHVVEINFIFSSSNSWVVDSGAGAHICSNMQALKRSRRLAKGEMQLKFGNGALVAVGDLDLILPNGLVIELSNVYYAPCASRKIIFVSCLVSHGFEFAFKNRCCTIFRNDLFYASAYFVNGLYVIDLGTPIYNISTKRLKISNTNSSFMWYYRLGHINEKCIKKLQDDGLLNQFDWESIDRCESYLLGKMTKVPFNKVNERAT
jgi:gag-polypeptide of LTR copia-type/GAG-pre-integrase domain